jgi:hypothetical protein
MQAGVDAHEAAALPWDGPVAFVVRRRGLAREPIVAAIRIDDEPPRLKSRGEENGQIGCGREPGQRLEISANAGGRHEAGIAEPRIRQASRRQGAYGRLVFCPGGYVFRRLDGMHESDKHDRARSSAEWRVASEERLQVHEALSKGIAPQAGGLRPARMPSRAVPANRAVRKVYLFSACIEPSNHSQ